MRVSKVHKSRRRKMKVPILINVDSGEKIVHYVTLSQSIKWQRLVNKCKTMAEM